MDLESEALTLGSFLLVSERFQLVFQLQDLEYDVVMIFWERSSQSSSFWWSATAASALAVNASNCLSKADWRSAEGVAADQQQLKK